MALGVKLAAADLLLGARHDYPGLLEFPLD